MNNNGIKHILIDIPADFKQLPLLMEHIERLLHVFGMEIDMDIEPAANDDGQEEESFISELEEEILKDMYIGKDRKR